MNLLSQMQSIRAASPPTGSDHGIRASTFATSGFASLDGGSVCRISFTSRASFSSESNGAGGWGARVPVSSACATARHENSTVVRFKDRSKLDIDPPDRSLSVAEVYEI